VPSSSVCIRCRAAEIRQLIGHGCCDAILHNSVNALKTLVSFRLKVRFRRFRVRDRVRVRVRVRVRLSGLPAAALHRMCTELLGTQLLPFNNDQVIIGHC